MKKCPSCHVPVSKATGYVCRKCGRPLKEFSLSGFRIFLWALISISLVLLVAYLVVPDKMTSLLVKFSMGEPRKKAVVQRSVVQPDAAGPVINPYDKFLKRYSIQPDAKIISSFELTIDLYNHYLKLTGLEADFSMGALSQSIGQVTIPVLKNKEPVATIQLPTDMSFQQALEGLSTCLNAMATDTAPSNDRHSPTRQSFDSGELHLSLNYLYEMDSRKIIRGLLGLEELIRSSGPDPKLILAAARGYAFLHMVLYPDKMGLSDEFGAQALSLLALANFLSPDMPSLREQALIAMNFGYKAHAENLVELIPATAQAPGDRILEAYLRKDFPRLIEFKGEGPRAMGYYFLTRLYRESGLASEAGQTAITSFSKLRDHYPSVVEMIYSADFRIARALTALYPLDILLRMQYAVGSKEANQLAPIKERLQIFLGKSNTAGKISFTEFEALLSQWQPIPDGVTAEFLIDSSRIKTIYRTLYSGAVYLRHNLLLNQLASMEKAKNYVEAISSGSETRPHPLAMLMSAEVLVSLGKFDQAIELCRRIIKHPQTKADLAMKAYFIVDDLQFKLRIAPGVFRKLDSSPANLARMGKVFQWLRNYDMASTFYTDALEKDPYAFSTYFHLAEVLRDPEPVASGLEKFPDNYLFLEKAGNYYKNSSDFQLKVKGLDCYDRALKQVPSRQPLWRQKALVLKELGKYEESRQTLISWLELYGSNNLTTTMMKSQLAKLLLKMEKPEQALEVLEKDRGSYQAGVMMVLADIYETLDLKEDAWAMHEKAVKRYPNVNHVLSGAAAFLWRDNQFAAASEYISMGRQVNGNFSRWYFNDYMIVFSNSPEDKIVESYNSLIESGAQEWERKALAYRFQKEKRPEISYLIMSGVSYPNPMLEFENKIDQYNMLKQWQGQEAAQVILSPYLSPKLDSRLSLILFKEGMFDILLTEIKYPDDYPLRDREFMWLMKLMAWLVNEKPGSYHEELTQHYEQPGSDYYHSIGSYLMGKLPLRDLLALIRTPKQRCEFAYYIGFSYRMKNDFATAANWYQICLETGLTNNGEYHWASDELFWWAHIGTKNRHKNVAEDILAYREQVAAK